MASMQWYVRYVWVLLVLGNVVQPSGLARVSEVVRAPEGALEAPREALGSAMEPYFPNVVPRQPNLFPHKGSQVTTNVSKPNIMKALKVIPSQQPPKAMMTFSPPPKDIIPFADSSGLPTTRVSTGYMSDIGESANKIPENAMFERWNEPQPTRLRGEEVADELSGQVSKPSNVESRLTSMLRPHQNVSNVRFFALPPVVSGRQSESVALPQKSMSQTSGPQTLSAVDKIFSGLNIPSRELVPQGSELVPQNVIGNAPSGSSISPDVQSAPSELLQAPVKEIILGRKGSVLGKSDFSTTLPGLRSGISGASRVENVPANATATDSTPIRTIERNQLPDVSSTMTGLSRAKQLTDKPLLQQPDLIGEVSNKPVEDIGHTPTSALALVEPSHGTLIGRAPRMTSDQLDMLMKGVPQLQKSLSPDNSHFRLPEQFKVRPTQSSRDAVTVTLQNPSDTTMRSSRAQQQEEKRWSDLLDAHQEPEDNQGFVPGVPLDEEKEMVPVDIQDASHQEIVVDKQKVIQAVHDVQKRFDTLQTQLDKVLIMMNDPIVQHQRIQDDVDEFTRRLNALLMQVGRYQAATGFGQQQYNQDIQKKILREQREMLERIEAQKRTLKDQLLSNKAVQRSSDNKKYTFDLKRLLVADRKLKMLEELQRRIIRMFIEVFLQTHLDLMQQSRKQRVGLGFHAQESIHKSMKSISMDMHDSITESDIYQLLNVAGEKIGTQMYQNNEYEVNQEQVLKWVDKDDLYQKLQLDKELYVDYLVQVVQVVMSYLQDTDQNA